MSLVGLDGQQDGAMRMNRADGLRARGAVGGWRGWRGVVAWGMGLTVALCVGVGLGVPRAAAQGEGSGAGAEEGGTRTAVGAGEGRAVDREGGAAVPDAMPLPEAMRTRDGYPWWPAGATEWQLARWAELRRWHAPTGLGADLERVADGDQEAWARLGGALLAWPPAQDGPGGGSGDGATGNDGYGAGMNLLALMTSHRALLPSDVQASQLRYWRSQLDRPRHASGLMTGGVGDDGQALEALLMTAEWTQDDSLHLQGRVLLEDSEARAWAFLSGLPVGLRPDAAGALPGLPRVMAAARLARFSRDATIRLQASILRDRAVDAWLEAWHPALDATVAPASSTDAAPASAPSTPSTPATPAAAPSPVAMVMHSLSQAGLPALAAAPAPSQPRDDTGLAVATCAPWGPPELSALIAATPDAPAPAAVSAAIEPATVVTRLTPEGDPSVANQRWSTLWRGPTARLATCDLDPNAPDRATAPAAAFPLSADWSPAPGAHAAHLVAGFAINGRRQPAFSADGVVQLGHKALWLASPRRGDLGIGGNPSLGAMLELDLAHDPAAREIWVNDGRLDLPLSATPQPGAADTRALHDGDTIAIRDGRTWIGLIPIVIHPLRRDAQVEIRWRAPTLRLESLMSRDPDAIAKADFGRTAGDWPAAGFAVEIVDADAYPDFAAFRSHLRRTAFRAVWQPDDRTWAVRYTSGPDTLAMHFRPSAAAAQPAAWRDPTPIRSTNGTWPPLPDGHLADGPWSVLATTGRLRKRGSTLTGEPGARLWLRVLPANRLVTAWNPLPTPTYLSLSLPDGLRVEADGRLGLTRIHIRPDTHAIAIDTANALGLNQRDDMARAILIIDPRGTPTVTLAGHPVTPERVELPDGGVAWRVPLVPGADWLGGGRLRYQRAQSTLRQILLTRPELRSLQAWRIVGPFNALDRPAGETVGPERAPQDSTYTDGLAGLPSPVQWQRIGTPDADPLGPGPIDLRGFIPALGPQDTRPPLAIYAATTIHSDRQRTVALHLGSDDALRAWLNGAPIYESRHTRRLYPDQDLVLVQLRAGPNALLLRQVAGPQRFAFTLRITEPTGVPADGLRYDP